MMTSRVNRKMEKVFDKTQDKSIYHIIRSWGDSFALECGLISAITWIWGRMQVEIIMASMVVQTRSAVVTVNAVRR